MGDTAVPTSAVLTKQAVRPVDSGRRTVYGDYVAQAIAARSAWHIQGPRAHEALCGKVLVGDISRMEMHVSLLECSTCMRLGSDLAEKMREQAPTGAGS